MEKAGPTPASRCGRMLCNRPLIAMIQYLRCSNSLPSDWLWRAANRDHGRRDEDRSRSHFNAAFAPPASTARFEDETRSLIAFRWRWSLAVTPFIGELSVRPSAE